MGNDETNEVAADARAGDDKRLASDFEERASGDERLASDLDEREGSDDERSVADLGS